MASRVSCRQTSSSPPRPISSTRLRWWERRGVPGSGQTGVTGTETGRGTVIAAAAAGTILPTGEGRLTPEETPEAGTPEILGTGPGNTPAMVLGTDREIMEIIGNTETETGLEIQAIRGTAITVIHVNGDVNMETHETGVGSSQTLGTEVKISVIPEREAET